MAINLGNSMIYEQLFSCSMYETITLQGGNLKPNLFSRLSESLCGSLLWKLAVLPEAVCHAK